MLPAPNDPLSTADEIVKLAEAMLMSAVPRAKSYLQLRTLADAMKIN
jgi:hypothetical protein